MLNDTVLSFIRTFVPVIVGALVAWLQPLGIQIDTVAAASIATAVFTAVYYTAARLLEKHFPKAGWLLGAPRQPVYAEEVTH